MAKKQGKKEAILVKTLLFMAICAIAPLSAEKNPKETFDKNAWLYSAYFDTRFPLYELGEMHLLMLRQMINERLGKHNDSYRDGQELYELTFGKDYLWKELLEKYP